MTIHDNRPHSEQKRARPSRRTLLAGAGATAVAAVTGVAAASSASADGFHYPKVRPGLVHYDDVLLLKSWLQANKYKPTTGSRFKVAYYDPQTQQLVKHFQARCRLKTDMIVGPKTWCALIARTAGRQKLRRGMSTNDVQLLQLALNARFDSGLKADVKFGAATEREVRRYQRMVGLKVDGVVGTRTWERLADGR